MYFGNERFLNTRGSPTLYALLHPSASASSVKVFIVIVPIAILAFTSTSTSRFHLVPTIASVFRLIISTTDLPLTLFINIFQYRRQQQVQPRLGRNPRCTINVPPIDCRLLRLHCTPNVGHLLLKSLRHLRCLDDNCNFSHAYTLYAYPSSSVSSFPF